jgi:hypothetical protein
VIPPQQLIVTASPPQDVADFWAALAKDGPDVFNAWFVLAADRATDD